MILYPFMEAEGMYKRMLECLKKDGFIYNLDKYEKVLNDRLFQSVRRMRQLVKRG